MREFKGFKVPDVGDFISTEKHQYDAHGSYCNISHGYNCDSINCEDCLFASEDTEHKEKILAFIEWHQQRQRGNNLEE